MAEFGRVLKILAIVLAFQAISVDSLAQTNGGEVQTPGVPVKGVFRSPGGSKRQGDSKNSPIFVKSETLNVDNKARLFNYKGNVEVTRDDMVITGDIVVGRYDESNKIETIVFEQNVVITRGKELRASSERAEYIVSTAKIIMTGAPELYHNGNALNADKVTIYIDEDRSEAEGDVQVKVINTQKESGGNLFKKSTEGSSSSAY